MRHAFEPQDLPPTPPPKSLVATPDGKAIADAAKFFGACTTEMILRKLDVPLSRVFEMKVAQVLRELGYTRHRLMIQGHRTYVFYPDA